MQMLFNIMSSMLVMTVIPLFLHINDNDTNDLSYVIVVRKTVKFTGFEFHIFLLHLDGSREVLQYVINMTNSR